MKTKIVSVVILALVLGAPVALADVLPNLTVLSFSNLRGTVNVQNTQLKVVGGSIEVANPSVPAERFFLQYNGISFFRAGGAFLDQRVLGANITFRTSEFTERDHTTLKLKSTGEAVVEVLEITGGSDLSETFDITSADDHAIEPGTVVSIDPASPGNLMVSHAAYDKKVVGIISGAGGLKTGMLMGQMDSLAVGEHPVALTGRVYCKVDATLAAVEPGDLLTTSATPGHAMKAIAHDAAMGAVIGKAMTPLAQGEKGLVLVLVTLQ